MLRTARTTRHTLVPRIRRFWLDQLVHPKFERPVPNAIRLMRQRRLRGRRETSVTTASLRGSVANLVSVLVTTFAKG